MSQTKEIWDSALDERGENGQTRTGLTDPGTPRAASENPHQQCHQEALTEEQMQTQQFNWPQFSQPASQFPAAELVN